jgi:hypothetical protein
VPDRAWPRRDRVSTAQVRVQRLPGPIDKTTKVEPSSSCPTRLPHKDRSLTDPSETPLRNLWRKRRCEARPAFQRAMKAQIDGARMRFRNRSEPPLREVKCSAARGVTRRCRRGNIESKCAASSCSIHHLSVFMGSRPPGSGQAVVHLKPAGLFTASDGETRRSPALVSFTETVRLSTSSLSARSSRFRSPLDTTACP